MHSRAYILLRRELEQLQRNTNEGVTAFPVSEDLMTWEAQIQGLENSIWEGFVFHLAIDFTPEYNLAPPAVKFLTIPFHPNVDLYTGQPSIDFLNSLDNWNTNYTLSSILLALQVMLSNPILENPVNLEAAQLFIKDESMYRRVIQKLSQPAPVTEGSLVSIEEPQERVRVIKTISFNDYYKTWSEIATSKTTELSKTPCSGSLSVGLLEKIDHQNTVAISSPKGWLSAHLQLKFLMILWKVNHGLMNQSQSGVKKTSQKKASQMSPGKRKWTTWSPGPMLSI
ncbi:ubiquitin-conjugating enzyme E2 U isoform X2 [Mesocricetus auratus]|uniref:Ubiquitin-conjugating enzyme E2 U isoform X2 n=1 Tax=Mesocricetus auratus TaxID=10036 RepID=A0ABM2YE10_MESAU|nr:ubiquitin-conjugating enzyme E2 U isoform X2 [Mesocricetus auratus]